MKLLDFGNIDDPRSFTTYTTFSLPVVPWQAGSVRPRPRFQVVVAQVARSFINYFPVNKYKETFGADISKDVFDVHGGASGHNQFRNDEKGFASFLKVLPEDSLVAMEATGYYHYRLAQFLYKNNVVVSVVSPLSVKRFIQMRLAKVKTDKSDARFICEYALANEVPLYSALTDVQAECLQLFRLMDSYLKNVPPPRTSCTVRRPCAYLQSSCTVH